MTREAFIRKWLGNKDKKYTEQFRDEMRDDLDKVARNISSNATKLVCQSCGKPDLEEGKKLCQNCEFDVD